MTWVKVCGLTHGDDVAAVMAAGADAIGFVNVAGSPRYVTLESAAELAAGVSALTVVLTMDLVPSEAIEMLRVTGMGGIQPYGHRAEQTAALAMASGYVALVPQKAVPGITVNTRSGIPLLDTPAEDGLGGTGRVWNWSLVAGLDERFVLAGGLGPDNIVEAVSQVRPWGVDASSRLERTPGRKDHGMVADFITKAKET